MMEILNQKLVDFDLVCSVKEGNYVRVKWLLENGANPHATCAQGRTCISHATLLKSPVGGISQLGVAILHLLESHGADTAMIYIPPEEAK